LPVASDSGYYDVIYGGNDASEHDTSSSMNEVKEEECVLKPINRDNLVKEFYELKPRYHLSVTLQDRETKASPEQKP